MSLRADVDRGLVIRSTIATLEAELKGIDARIKHAALYGDHVDLADADREGRQFMATGTDQIVPVILTADKIIGSFKANTPAHLKLVSVLGPDEFCLKEFFAKQVTFENVFDNGKKFRQQATELLGETAPAFITACVLRDKFGIPKSDIKICWGDAKAKSEVAK